MVKNPPANAGDIETWVGSLGREDPLEEGTATHSSILSWRTPWREESGRLQPMGSHRVRHDWSNLACSHNQIFYGMTLNLSLSYFLMIRLGLLIWGERIPRRWGPLLIASYQEIYDINVMHILNHLVKVVSTRFIHDRVPVFLSSSYAV